MKMPLPHGEGSGSTFYFCMGVLVYLTGVSNWVELLKIGGLCLDIERKMGNNKTSCNLSLRNISD